MSLGGIALSHFGCSSLAKGDSVFFAYCCSQLPRHHCLDWERSDMPGFLTRRFISAVLGLAFASIPFVTNCESSAQTFQIGDSGEMGGVYGNSVLGSTIEPATVGEFETAGQVLRRSPNMMRQGRRARRRERAQSQSGLFSRFRKKSSDAINYVTEDGAEYAGISSVVPDQRGLLGSRLAENPFSNEGWSGGSPGRFYLGTFGGWNSLDDYQGSVGTPAVNLRGAFSDGFVAGIAIGKNYGQRLRHEIEGTYRYNSGDQWRATGLGTTARTPLGGHLNQFGLMTNLFYNLGQLGRVQPYVGGGVGMAVVDGNLNVAASRFSIDETTWGYQAMFGFSAQQTESAEFFTEYRFFGTGDINLDNLTSATSSNFKYQTHNLLFGFRMWR